MLTCWKVCPALAMGNTVVLKPASYTRLSSLLFAEICAEAGLPAGVFNVVTGNSDFGSQLVCHDDVDKIAFTGSTQANQILIFFFFFLPELMNENALGWTNFKTSNRWHWEEIIFGVRW